MTYGYRPTTLAIGKNASTERTGTHVWSKMVTPGDIGFRFLLIVQGATAFKKFSYAASFYLVLSEKKFGIFQHSFREP